MLSQLPEWNWQGTAWKYYHQVRTYRPSPRVFYKNLCGLSPESEEDFWHIIQSCQSACVRLPGSYASIFHQVYTSAWAPYSTTALFRSQRVGAWQEAFVRGHCKGPLYKYDLNSAYQWAASLPLPDMRSWHRVERVENDWHLCFGTVERLPFYLSSNHPQLWTREEIEQGKLVIKDFFYGVVFDQWIDLTSTFQAIRQWFPYCYKRIGRAFWGRWNTTHYVEQVSWRNGQTRSTYLRNPIFNPFWARYITSRVKVRLAEIVAQVGAVQVYVDSVICYDPLPTGEAVGDWRLVDEFSELDIHGAGVYTEKQRIVKRSGLTEHQAGALCRSNKS